jgi:hypothetical protein
MKRTLPGLAAGLLALLLVTPAHAEPDASRPSKTTPVLRCAHSYAEALAEAKDRGCVVFVTLHRDG